MHEGSLHLAIDVIAYLPEKFLKLCRRHNEDSVLGMLVMRDKMGHIIRRIKVTHSEFPAQLSS